MASAGRLPSRARPAPGLHRPASCAVDIGVPAAFIPAPPPPASAACVLAECIQSRPLDPCSSATPVSGRLALGGGKEGSSAWEVKANKSPGTCRGPARPGRELLEPYQAPPGGSWRGGEGQRVACPLFVPLLYSAVTPTSDLDGLCGSGSFSVYLGQEWPPHGAVRRSPQQQEQTGTCLHVEPKSSSSLSPRGATGRDEEAQLWPKASKVPGGRGGGQGAAVFV